MNIIYDFILEKHDKWIASSIIQDDKQTNIDIYLGNIMDKNISMIQVIITCYLAERICVELICNDVFYDEMCLNCPCFVVALEMLDFEITY